MATPSSTEATPPPNPFENAHPVGAVSLTAPVSAEDFLWFAATALEVLAKDFEFTTRGWCALSHEKCMDFNMMLLKETDQKASDLLVKWSDKAKQHDIPVLIITPPSKSLVDTPLSAALTAKGLPLVGQLPVMTFSVHTHKHNLHHVLHHDTSVHPYTVDFIRTDGDAKLREEQIANLQRLNSAAFKLPLDTVQRVIDHRLCLSPTAKSWVCRTANNEYLSTVVSVVFPHLGRRIGSLWSMATDPAHQRKGAGKTVLKHALKYLIEEEKCEIVMLSATPEGFPLYKHVGFETVDLLNVYAQIPATQGAESGTGGNSTAAH